MVKPPKGNSHTIIFYMQTDMGDDDKLKRLFEGPGRFCGNMGAHFCDFFQFLFSGRVSFFYCHPGGKLCISCRIMNDRLGRYNSSFIKILFLYRFGIIFPVQMIKPLLCKIHNFFQAVVNQPFVCCSKVTVTALKICPYIRGFYLIVGQERLFRQPAPKPVHMRFALPPITYMANIIQVLLAQNVSVCRSCIWEIWIPFDKFLLHPLHFKLWKNGRPTRF